MSDEKQKCELCGRVGNNGAQWLVTTNNSQPVRVHKPCGEQLVALAPAAVDARLVPSRALRDQWVTQKTQRQARDFWSEKFDNARPLDKQKKETTP